MPFVSVANTVRVEVRTTWNGQQCENVLHVNVGNTPTAADCQSTAETVLDWWTTTARLYTSNQCILREVYCRSLAALVAPEFTAVPTTGATGNLGTESMPNNVTFCISLRTGNAGRSGRGRWFWVGLTAEQVTGTIMDGGSVTELVAALQTLIGLISGPGDGWVIVSYVSNKVPRPVPVEFAITTAVAVDNVVDSQRRRLPGRGR